MVVIGLLITNYIRKDEIELDFERRFGLYNLTDEEKNRITDLEVNGAHELIRLMCFKNGDWSKLPISKETRQQYNEKEGILKDYKFTTAEVDYEDVEFYDASPAKIIITNGKEKKRVYVDYRFTDDGINYININDVITIVDANGNKLNVGFPFDKNHIEQNFETWVNVGLTDKYILKHGKDLLNLFIHYSPLQYNPIDFDRTKSDLNNSMAYFIVKSELECKEREYEVYFQLDNNYYLDDAYAMCVNEMELEPTNKYETEKLIYPNSNWERLELSENFKFKFNSKNGILNIEEIMEYEFEKIEENVYILMIVLIDKSVMYFLDSEKYTDDGELDDMIIKKCHMRI